MDWTDWLPEALRKCLLSQGAKVMGRITPEGRAVSKAVMQWKTVVEEKAAAKEKASKTMAKMSPTGRAMGKGIRAWTEFVKEKKRKEGAMKKALARMTPEGRAKHSGLQCFKSRNPMWMSGPSRIISPDGFWVASNKSGQERESAFGTPEVIIKRDPLSLSLHPHLHAPLTPEPFSHTHR